MEKKRVLIVDDDKDISRLLQHTLKTLGPEYEIITVGDTVSAINLIEKEWFTLVLTDYMMPIMTGVDLALAVQRISPETQVVLMTAYGTAELRHTTKYLGIDGYLDKPFELERIREIVRQAVERTSRKKKPPLLDERLRDPRVYEQLRTLQANAGVRCVLLITSNGYPVQIVGQTEDFEVREVSALVAANFLAATELANLLGNQTVFKSSYHEGDNYNIYAYDVNGQLLLALVFEAKQRPGSVWFYTKQTAMALVEFLRQSL
jgi:CheY-like chemotaxis protein/predicted regulator of Ras-like GTPase activity (Roadblock/LC7/MglB family)